ncbi:MAG: activase [Desulfobacterales bacterium]|nr:activase [Desulfobacterales bacterium]
MTTTTIIEHKGHLLENKVDAPVNTRSLGICLGASTISIVQLEKYIDMEEADFDHICFKTKKLEHSIHPHDGNPKKALISALKNIDVKSFSSIAITGRKFRRLLKISQIAEPEAVEYAYKYLKNPHISCPAIVSAGGETFMVYVLNSAGEISNVVTGNKCASGTGEFFVQQMRRMDISFDDVLKWQDEQEHYSVSGRCSVFCKSDCTHATNKGISKSRVASGLCKMMSDKIMELLKNVDKRNVMVVGGSSKNKIMIQFLEKEIDNVIVPEEASYFEAFGAALWALENKTNPFPGIDDLFLSNLSSFKPLPPLKNFQSMVEFKKIEMDTVRDGDICILGLDVGSTTTKAVLLRENDNAILASIYIRTNGDPVNASKTCYKAIWEQIKSAANPENVIIKGVGVTGSGRQIAGLHTLTDGVINEIIAHAAAAVYFDPKVDTIFEIGGQDAKYTYITNSTPSDYAMNEACSAGTGSFLEESAYEALGVKMENIAEIALKAKFPPNFNDQCAAFIASDIKNAIHEGVVHEDIIAGLVYSICMNYSNRVKGNRPVGEKVFMQGGVCYNSAVPLAMASISGKTIVVPPEPGLMGAFGVALVIKKKIASGLIKQKIFDLKELADRNAEYGKKFICKGGDKDKCDRRCEISIVKINGEKYPFGGACNRYYNLRNNINYDSDEFDFVRKRQQMIFQKPQHSQDLRKRIGINKSFLVNTYYPLYSAFFSSLGFDIVLPESPSPQGYYYKNASFCYPAENAHCFFYSLLNMQNPPEYIFLPHFRAVPASKGHNMSQVCPLVQGETFYLNAAFRDTIQNLKSKGVKFLNPLIDFTKGLKHGRKTLIKMAVAELGVSKREAEIAFNQAINHQQGCFGAIKEIGKNLLKNIESSKDEIAIIVFGRPYNAFAEESHMGIPKKIASRGIKIIPFDFLPFEDEKNAKHMYWGMGQIILKTAQFVKKHPQLFGLFITNFSCGPDSFIIGYFRDIMGEKPSLTLELDSHTADAGVETRIEAFIDIIQAYRQIVSNKNTVIKRDKLKIAKTIISKNEINILLPSGKKLPITHPNVTLLLPSIGKYASESLASAFKNFGINAIAHPPADEEVLKLGRGNTSCKECLPLILTTGSLLNYIYNEKKKDENLVYFMPTAEGPCRFGQYYVFMENLMRKLEIHDVALFSLTSENSYAGLGNKFYLRSWWAVLISDAIEDIRSMLLTNSKNVEYAMDVFEREWALILASLEFFDFEGIERQLYSSAKKFAQIPMKIPVEEVPVISLAGEIFVRREGLSRQFITERLAKRGFATVCASIAEWIIYSDYLLEHGLAASKLSIKNRIEFLIKKLMMSKYEKKIKTILGASGLINPHPFSLKPILNASAPYISKNLTGEAVLTIGSALHDIAVHNCGVIAIGPFGCMPNRLSESILNVTMNKEDKLKISPASGALFSILSAVEDLPFLAIESDGSPFPQLITAKLDSFCLRAKRMHERMLLVRKN